MWGLIYKDIVTNKKQFILFAVCSAVLFAIMVAALFIADDFGEYTEVSAQAVSLMAVTCAFLPWLDLPTSLIKNDEGRHWGGFVSASPVSAKGQVASKYVLGFAVLVVIVNMLYFLLQICDIILYYSAGVTAMSGTISFALMLAFAVMLLWSVEIPFTVYFGSQTGGAVKFLLFLAVVLGFIVYGLYGRTRLSFDGLWALFFSEDIKIYAFTIGSELFCAAAYLLSYPLSCRLYPKGAENNG